MRLDRNTHKDDGRKQTNTGETLEEEGRCPCQAPVCCCSAILCKLGNSTHRGSQHRRGRQWAVYAQTRPHRRSRRSQRGGGGARGQVLRFAQESNGMASRSPGDWCAEDDVIVRGVRTPSYNFSLLLLKQTWRPTCTQREKRETCVVYVREGMIFRSSPPPLQEGVRSRGEKKKQKLNLIRRPCDDTTTQASVDGSRGAAQIIKQPRRRFQDTAA